MLASRRATGACSGRSVSGSRQKRLSQVRSLTDGREEALAQEGVLRVADDRVVFDTGRIHRECWPIEPDTLCLRFWFAVMPESSVAEMIQRSADGVRRAGTRHRSRHRALEKVTLVNERRATGVASSGLAQILALLRRCEMAP